MSTPLSPHQLRALADELHRGLERLTAAAAAPRLPAGAVLLDEDALARIADAIFATTDPAAALAILGALHDAGWHAAADCADGLLDRTALDPRHALADLERLYSTLGPGRRLRLLPGLIDASLRRGHLPGGAWLAQVDWQAIPSEVRLRLLELLAQPRAFPEGGPGLAWWLENAVPHELPQPMARWQWFCRALCGGQLLLPEPTRHAVATALAGWPWPADEESQLRCYLMLRDSSWQKIVAGESFTQRLEELGLRFGIQPSVDPETLELDTADNPAERAPQLPSAHAEPPVAFSVATEPEPEPEPVPAPLPPAAPAPAQPIPAEPAPPAPPGPSSSTEAEPDAESTAPLVAPEAPEADEISLELELGAPTPQSVEPEPEDDDLPLEPEDDELPLEPDDEADDLPLEPEDEDELPLDDELPLEPDEGDDLPLDLEEDLEPDPADEEGPDVPLPEPDPARVDFGPAPELESLVPEEGDDPEGDDPEGDPEDELELEEDPLPPPPVPQPIDDDLELEEDPVPPPLVPEPSLSEWSVPLATADEIDELDLSDPETDPSATWGAPLPPPPEEDDDDLELDLEEG